MTDRFNALTVVLEQDTRDDDCEALINAIGQMRNVVGVTGNVTSIDSHVAEMRAITTLTTRVLDVLRNLRDTP